MSWTVLVTARAFWVSGQEAEAMLEAAGCEVRRSSKAGPLPEEDLIAQLQGCDGVIGSSDPYNGRVFAACPQLKVVARCGVGTDSVDMKAATEAGILATNTPGAMTEGVADFAFGLMLSIARRIPDANALMRAGGWDEIRGVLVYGKTLGLVGMGRIGAAVARRAQGFRMRLLVCDPMLQAAFHAGEPAAKALVESIGGAVEFVTLETLLAGADFVSLHAPATPETLGLLNADRFAQMKPTAYLINTARGSLINEADLVAALETGQIAGAALDVYSKEPPPADHPLRSAPNCVLAPHNAFNALESTQEMSRQSALSILDPMQGRMPASVCNPDVLTSPLLRIPPLK